ncbi:hypothetical protein D3C87_2059310 [compost metagenome]
MKAAAQSVNRPYQPQQEAQNEIRPPRPEPVAQAEPVAPVAPAVQLTAVPPVNSQRESEPVSESAGKGEVKP